MAASSSVFGFRNAGTRLERTGAPFFLTVAGVPFVILAAARLDLRYVGRHHPGFGHHALPGASYLRDETSFVSLPVLVSSLFFVPSISTSVRTAPSILLSVVRYGRTRSEYLRPPLSVTLRSRVPRVSITSRKMLSKSGTSMFGRSSLSGRPMSVGKMLNAARAAGVARRTVNALSTITIGI